MEELLPNEHAVYIEKKSIEIARHPSERFHDHAGYELYYLFDGERRMLFENGIEYYLHAGDMMLIPPRIQHSTCSGDSPLVHNRIIFNFDRQYIHSTIEQMGDFEILPLFFPNEHVLTIPERKRLLVENLIGDLCRELTSHQAGYEYFSKNLLCCILILLIRSRDYAKTMRSSGRAAAKEHLYRMVEFVSSNYSEDLSLELLAKLFYSDTTTISKEFKSITGLNFIDYLNQKRIEAARELLTGTRMSVSSIATQVGYNSATYFERVFKKQYGVPPKAYRVQHLTKENSSNEDSHDMDFP